MTKMEKKSYCSEELEKQYQETIKKLLKENEKKDKQIERLKNENAKKW